MAKKNSKTRSKFGVDYSAEGIRKRQAVDVQTKKKITFDSKLEKEYYEEVVLKGIKDKTIERYELQKKYKLQPSFKYHNKTIREINYVSDFAIWFTNGDFLLVDVKGRPTADAKIKKKLMHYVYPDINFIWVTKCIKHGGWLEFDELTKKRRDERLGRNGN